MMTPPLDLAGLVREVAQRIAEIPKSFLVMSGGRMSYAADRLPPWIDEVGDEVLAALERVQAEAFQQGQSVGLVSSWISHESTHEELGIPEGLQPERCNLCKATQQLTERVQRETREADARWILEAVVDIGCTAIEAEGVVRRTRNALAAALRGEGGNV